MKALSLWQPWASLVALGVKTIETRSWATTYRGPLAIHAGVRRPEMMHLPPLSRIGRGVPEGDRSTWLCIDVITDPAHQRPHRTDIRDRVPKRATTPTLFFPHAGPWGRPWDEKAGTSAIEQDSAMYLPLGAVVASARLVDCAPMGRWDSFRTGVQEGDEGDWPGRHVVVVHDDGGLSIDHPADCGHPGGTQEDVSDQHPFGDFRPGRWAWLLDDVRPVERRCPACWDRTPDAAPGVCVSIDGDWWHEPGSCPYCASACPVCKAGTRRVAPMPARGRQGLWEWEPTT